MILVLPVIPWGFLRQRPQHFLSDLAARGMPSIYLAVTGDERWNPTDSAASWSSLTRLEPGIFSLWAYSATGFDLHESPLVSDTAQELFERICATYDWLEITPTFLLVQHPGWEPLVARLRKRYGCPLIYDCMDDHSAFPRAKPELLEHEDPLIAASDWVLASSQLLFEKCKQLNTKTLLIRNASDPEHFGSAHHARPTDLPPGPIAMYYGSVHDWFDTEVFRAAAAHRPETQFVLIGEIEASVAQQLQAPNIHLLGRRSYTELPAYAEAADVFLLTFRVSPLTLATNPVKLYEHLATGKPMVAISLPELEVCSELLYLADNADSFCRELDAAFDEAREPDRFRDRRNDRIRFATRQTWPSRVEEFLIGTGLIAQIRQGSEFAALIKLYEKLSSEDIAYHDQRWQLEYNRIISERVTLLADKDRDWQEEVDRNVAVWRDEVDRNVAVWRSETERLIEEREMLLRTKDQEWEKLLEKLLGELRHSHVVEVSQLEERYKNLQAMFETTADERVRRLFQKLRPARTP